jgi:4-amino-4-deoxy-L-arabinose transferase
MRQSDRTRDEVPVKAIRRHWVLAIAVLVYACLFQGVRPIYSPDEGRYTNVALVMLDDGDWLHPMLHHEVEHWSKPPLTYWAIASSIGLFGKTEWAARLPGALAFAGTILVLVQLGRRFVPQRPWLAGIVYATFAGPSIAANIVTTDTLLALWEALVVLSFLKLWHCEEPSQTSRTALWLGTFAALAFMTKGPPGLLTLASCLVFAAWTTGWSGLRRTLRWETLLAFALLGLSWFVVVVVQDRNVLHHFLVEEVVNRVATDKMHRNAEAFGAIKVYLPTLLLGTLPWLPFLGVAAWRHRTGFLARVRTEETTRLLACWILVPLIVFVISRSRLPLYILPLFAPLAIVVAMELSNARFTKFRWGLVAAWAALLVAIRAMPVLLDPAEDDRQLAREIAVLTDPTPDEIAFVESAPRFGLRFYLGASVERIRLPGSMPLPQSQDLASELAENEGCRLMVTEPEHVASLGAELDAFGAPFHRLLDVRGYALFAELTSDCSWTRESLH